MNFEEIEQILSQTQSKKRYEHTLGVVNTAEELAVQYAPEMKEKARWAALLHDCAKTKDASPEGMWELAKESLFDHKPVLEDGESLLHAAASEVLARKKFGVEDRDILSAVRWHTTGHWGMTELEMIVYCADMIEPNRSYPEVAQLRSLADKGLLTLAKGCCRATVQHLEEKKSKIDEQSKQMLLYLDNIEGKDGMENRSKEIMEEIVRVLQEKLAQQVDVINIGEVSILADYFVIASGRTNTQVRALYDYVDEAVKKKFDLDPIHREGVQNARWIAIDYGCVIVHLFHQDEREFYSIEKLWAEAPRVEV